MTLSEGSGAVWVFATSPAADAQLSQRRTAREPVIMSASGTTTARTAPVAAAPAAAPGASVLNGVFTSAQAARGLDQFTQACATCHAIDDQAASLRAKWGTATLADLFGVISKTMPQNTPGSLSQEEYASILALYLQRSGHTAGDVELTADPTALGRLRIAP